MKPTSLDHFVMVPKSVDDAAAAYIRLGFVMTDEARHAEIGTFNRVIQLTDTYIEFIGDIERGPEMLTRQLFPLHALGEGLAMISMTSADLPGDRDDLERRGWEPMPILNARRPVRLPDGRSDETNSHCFYVLRESNPFTNLFLSQHYKPETIWISSYMCHPNTAQRITGLTIIANPLEADLPYFEAMLAAEPAELAVDDALFITPRGEKVRLVSGERAASEFPKMPSYAARLPGYCVAVDYQVSDLSVSRSCLETAGVEYETVNGFDIVGPADAAGVHVRFHA